MTLLQSDRLISVRESRVVVPTAGEQVDGMVNDVVTVTEVELGEQGHMADNEPQEGICDVQASEAQFYNVPELAPIVHLTWPVVCGWGQDIPHLGIL